MNSSKRVEDFSLDALRSGDRAEFARFVEDTGYQSTAETAGWGWVHVGDEWVEMSGADWQHPRGSDSDIEDKMVLSGVRNS